MTHRTYERNSSGIVFFGVNRSDQTFESNPNFTIGDNYLNAANLSVDGDLYVNNFQFNSGVTINTDSNLFGGDFLPLGSSITIGLSDTSVSSGVYGSATQIPTFTVDSKGRLTDAANIEIDLSASGITGLEDYVNSAVFDSGKFLDSSSVNFTVIDDTSVSADVIPGLSGEILSSDGNEVLWIENPSGNLQSQITQNAYDITVVSGIASSGFVLPTGGLEGQILYKVTDSSDDMAWIDNYATEVREIVKNDTGSDLLKGTVVMATGAVGDRIQVAPAIADGSVEARYMFGVLSEDIDNGQEGYVTLVGPLKGISTIGLPLGTVLWIDPDNPGGLTNTQPTSPNLQMSVAIVTNGNANNGRIFVRMWEQQPGLHELHDVNVDVGLASGDLIGYDSSNGTWRNIENPSGNLQSQITQNAGDIAAVSGIVNGTPSGIAFFGSDGNLTQSSTFVRNLSNGRIGVGISNPTRTLDVNGDIRFTSSIFSNFAGSPNIDLTGSVAGANLFVKLGVNNGDFSFRNNWGATSIAAAGFRISSLEISTSSSTSSAPIYLSTNSLKRLTVGFDGDIGIGTISADAQLHVVNDTASDVSVIVQGAATQTANLQEWQNSAGTALAYVDAAGNASFKDISVENLSVSGTFTYVNSSNVTIADKQLELGSQSGVAVSGDAFVDDGGIVLKSTDGDKQWIWKDATDSWYSSENVSINAGKYLIFGDATLQTTAYTGQDVTLSGVLQPQITQNADNIATVSGLLSDYVPYSGATQGVDLGSNGLTAAQATLVGGTVTSSTPVIDATQTWNDGATTFTGVLVDVTNTASATGSNVVDFKLNNISRLKVNSSGRTVLRALTFADTSGGEDCYFTNTSPNSNGTIYSNAISSFTLQHDNRHFIIVPKLGYAIAINEGRIGFQSGYGNLASPYSQMDCYISRDASGKLAQRNGIASQTFRVYNTYSSATSYERAKLEWSSGVLNIGTEFGSAGGQATPISIQTSGIDRIRVDVDGDIGVGTTSPEAHLHVANDTASEAAVIVQGAAAQSANLQEWQNSNGDILSYIGGDGSIHASTGNTIYDYNLVVHSGDSYFRDAVYIGQERDLGSGPNATLNLNSYNNSQIILQNHGQWSKYRIWCSLGSLTFQDVSINTDSGFRFIPRLNGITRFNNGFGLIGSTTSYTDHTAFELRPVNVSDFACYDISFKFRQTYANPTQFEKFLFKKNGDFLASGDGLFSGNIISSGNATIASGVILPDSIPVDTTDTLHNNSGILRFDDFYVPPQEKDPSFTYTSGLLTRVDYPTGNYKEFTYDASGVLQTSSYVSSSFTLNKQFVYYIDGNLSGVITNL